MSSYLPPLIAFALLLPACSRTERVPVPSHEERILLEDISGRLARYWCMPPDSDQWRQAPAQDEITELIGYCDANPGAWTYFYRCLSDSANALPPPEF